MTSMAREILSEMTRHNDEARELARGRMLAGRVETWHDLIDLLPRDRQAGLLKDVLRTRRRVIPVTMNGRLWPVRRAELRDYLRQVDLPRFLRSRPVSKSASPTVRFRRPLRFTLE